MTRVGSQRHSKKKVINQEVVLELFRSFNYETENLKYSGYSEPHVNMVHEMISIQCMIPSKINLFTCRLRSPEK